MSDKYLSFRLRFRAHYRRKNLICSRAYGLTTDALSDLLEEAADEIERLEKLQVSPLNKFINQISNLYDQYFTKLISKI